MHKMKNEKQIFVLISFFDLMRKMKIETKFFFLIWNWKMKNEKKCQIRFVFKMKNELHFRYTDWIKMDLFLFFFFLIRNGKPKFNFSFFHEKWKMEFEIGYSWTSIRRSWNVGLTNFILPTYWTRNVICTLSYVMVFLHVVKKAYLTWFPYSMETSSVA